MSIPSNNIANLSPVIFGCSGPDVTSAEISLFKQVNPFGFILFERNCKTRAQLKRLVEVLREIVDWHCPILIDQEGGRVARMRLPEWQSHPSAGSLGKHVEEDAKQGLEKLRDAHMALANELVEVGIDVNCFPVLDVPRLGFTDNVVGDRAYSDNPDIVGICGKLSCEVMVQSGITPVVKHLPGHGGAACDSHHALPHVTLQAQDLQPFYDVTRDNAFAWGMVAHLLIPERDPNLPSSLSRVIIQDIIRGDLGFDGLLLSDDLSMGALSAYGDEVARARNCLIAGMDIALHCNGTVDEMSRVMDSLPAMREDSVKRIETWLKHRPHPKTR